MNDLDIVLASAVAAAAVLLALALALSRGSNGWIATIAAPSSVVVGVLAGSVVGGRRFELVPDRMDVSGGVALGAAAVMVGAVALATAVDRAGLVPILLPVTAVGMYACLPDVEAPLAAVAATGVLAVWSLVRAPGGVTSWISGALAGGALGWVVLTGGQGRAGSVVGGVACLGLLLVWPPMALAIGSRRQPAGGWWVVVAVALAVHVPLVAYCSRVAGLERDVGDAVALAAPALAVAAGVVAVLVGAGWMPARHAGSASGEP